MRACMCSCVRACVHACMRACMYACVYVCVRACVQTLVSSTVLEAVDYLRAEHKCIPGYRCGLMLTVTQMWTDVDKCGPMWTDVTLIPADQWKRGGWSRAAIGSLLYRTIELGEGLVPEYRYVYRSHVGILTVFL